MADTLRFRTAAVFLAFALFLLVGSVAAQSGITVNFTDVHQRIDGFGASDAFLSFALTDAQADTLFSPTAGIGLSFLRMGISTTGGLIGGAYSDATKAAARGAKVWAAPWGAPAAYKDNNDVNNGGALLTSAYNAWATTLAGFQATLVANAGVNLYALSVQNEPDYTASYTSMRYTPAQMTAFIDVLGPKLAALSPKPLLMMPETSSWGGVAGYAAAVAADSTAQSYLGIMASHQYAGIAAQSSSFRPIWETEMSGFNAFDGSIGDGLGVAVWIHDALVNGGVSAWHYWWLIGHSGDNEGLWGLNNATAPTKRLYTMGNYSKFVRPGYVLVGTTGSVNNVWVAAFLNPGTQAFVIVAVNNQGDTPITIGLNGLTASSVTPWVTSSTLDLAQQSPLTVSGGSFTATLPTYSVTSFVGAGSGTAVPPAAPTGLIVQ